MNNEFIFIGILSCIGLPLMIYSLNFIGKQAKSEGIRSIEDEDFKKWVESTYEEMILRYRYSLPENHPDHPDYMRMVVHQMD